MRSVAVVGFLTFLATLSTPDMADADVITDSNVLPPAGSVYSSNHVAVYATPDGTVQATNLVIGSFDNSFAPPTTIGQTINFSLNAIVSQDTLFILPPYQTNVAPAASSESVTLFSQVGDVSTYNTQLTSLAITGGSSLPPDVEERVSLTIPSTGQTTITDLGGGQYQIASFFDVYTEISLDSGATWTADANGPTVITLSGLPVPEPSSFMLCLLASGSGLVGYARRVRRPKSS